MGEMEEKHAHNMPSACISVLLSVMLSVWTGKGCSYSQYCQEYNIKHTNMQH